MVRALRYPRLCGLICALTVLFALGRDACVSAGQDAWAQVLLFATLMGLAACFTLMSSRITVDEMGIGVGFLLNMRYSGWDELASLGLLCCNSRRPYLFGMYRDHVDFVNMLHCAPRCGTWGFVAPMNAKLKDAVKRYCPYPVDLTPIAHTPRPAGQRRLWQQTALYALVMIPSALLAFVTCAAMIVYSVVEGVSLPAILSAAALLAAGVLLVKRTVTTFQTCPAISEEGVAIGRGVYMPWEEVRFAYVHRVGKISGLFFLSRELEEVSKLSAPPVMCLSMPDTSTLLLAYLMYCPHAPREV